ncbi:MAG: hypothetical protein WKF37_07020 [Bryobacteraceae bacterium]
MTLPRLLCVFALLLTGCTDYAEFALPQRPGPQGKVTWTWMPSPAPLLQPGSAGDWDDVDVLNPSIVHFKGMLWNLYSGYDGSAWHTGTAISTDGQHWQKKEKILSPDASTWEGDYIAANGTALEWNGRLHYWYQGGRSPQIGLAQSSDGQHWTRHGEPVVRFGPRGSWDERGVADPYILQTGDPLYVLPGPGSCPTSAPRSCPLQ